MRNACSSVQLFATALFEVWSRNLERDRREADGLRAFVSEPEGIGRLAHEALDVAGVRS